jgi:hypothetical protein
MNDNLGPEDLEGLGDVEAVDEAAARGIVVDEPIDIECIELGELPISVQGAPGWETVPVVDDATEDEPYDSFSASEVLPAVPDEDLGTELLAQVGLKQSLPAEQSSGESRDAEPGDQDDLLAELQGARELLAQRETEYSDQEAQIASLTLECAGLRDQLRDQLRSRPRGRQLDDDGASVVAGSLDLVTASRQDDRVARLKERLDESSRALARTREQVEVLSRGRNGPEQAVAAGASATDGAQDRLPFFARLLQLFRRLRGVHAVPFPDEPFVADVARAEEAAFAGEPGSEVPTMVMAESQASAPRAAVIPASAAAETRRSTVSRQADAAHELEPGAAVALRRYLIALDPEQPDVLELVRPRMYVGRGREADLRMPDATISRLHAVISQGNGATIVEDASSTNGVFVNGQRIRRAVLKDGDSVTFGTVSFQYRIGPGAA